VKTIFLKSKENFTVGSFFHSKVDVCLMNSVVAYMSKEELLKIIDTINCKKIILLDVKDELFESKTYE
tara:strand:- start:503 stop:706 length:204 start_codon:yes stop_codon:yes gene_type:complete